MPCIGIDNSGSKKNTEKIIVDSPVGTELNSNYKNSLIATNNVVSIVVSPIAGS